MLSKIEHSLRSSMEDVSLVVEDFIPMKHKLKDIVGYIEKIKSYSKLPQKFSESVSFLNWLLEDNFIFLGYNYFNISHDKNINKKVRRQNKKKTTWYFKRSKEIPSFQVCF